MKPTETQIQDQIDQALENPDKFPGMTYEEGVENALRWVLGITKDKPMDD